VRSDARDHRKESEAAPSTTGPRDRVFAAFVVLASSIGIACGDPSGDAPHGGDAGADGVSDIHAPPADVDPSFDAAAICALLVPTGQADVPCDETNACGNGGVCISQSPGSAACADICLPDLCGETCEAGRVCSRLIDENGDELRVGLGDGGASHAAGACLQPVAGVQQAYEVCGGSYGPCAEGLLCAGIPGRPDGTCFPECQVSCDLHANFLPECLATGGDQRICVVLCDPAFGETACPPELQCVTIGDGFAACSR